MNDKEFVSDFYIGENNAENTENTLPAEELPQEVESEILLNSFSDEEFAQIPEKQGVFAKLRNWWKARKKWQKATIISSLAVITAVSIVLGILSSGMGYNYNRISTDYEELGFENIIDKDIVNIALFGIDTRSLESFKGNADSIMVLSLNTKTKKVKIISIMRDSFVPVIYNGDTVYSKINGAYSRGGPELAIKVINSNFGLDITEYATVNFFGMVDIIDAIGGIEAELTEEEVVSSSVYFYALNGAIAEICTTLNLSAKDNFIETPGKQHLNGVQAVAYSRIRKVKNIWGTNNDYGRTDRQRYVMEQLFNKALTMEKSQYMKLAKSLIPCTETSLSYKEILGLAFDMLLESPTFLQARIPRDDMLMKAPNTRAGSVVYYDLDFAKELIHAFIYDDITFDQYVEENGVEKNDWYREAIYNKNNSGNKNNSSSQNKPSNDKGNQNNYDSETEDIIDPDDDVSVWVDEEIPWDEPIDSDMDDTSAIWGSEESEWDDPYSSDDLDSSSNGDNNSKDESFGNSTDEASSQSGNLKDTESDKSSDESNTSSNGNKDKDKNSKDESSDNKTDEDSSQDGADSKDTENDKSSDESNTSSNGNNNSKDESSGNKNAGDSSQNGANSNDDSGSKDSSDKNNTSSKVSSDNSSGTDSGSYDTSHDASSEEKNDGDNSSEDTSSKEQSSNYNSSGNISSENTSSGNGNSENSNGSGSSSSQTSQGNNSAASENISSNQTGNTSSSRNA